MTDTSRNLLDRYRAGSEDAATAIFDRYVRRLTALARVRLSEKLARRIDPDDVVMSAYRSFFVAARNGRYSLEQCGDLWRLLVSIVMHKLHRQVAAHQTQKRSISAELGDFSEQFIARDPAVEDVVAASDELEAILRALPPLVRHVVELRLQGETIDAIALEIRRNERTVRRLLDQARSEFEKRITEGGDRPIQLAKNVVVSSPKKAEESQPSAILRPRKADNRTALRYDDFLLQQMIGAGGSGKVYAALQRSTGGQLALKFLRKSFVQSDEIVQRFITEASLISRIRHPGIIAVHGLGQTPWSGYFLAMDLLPGPDLQVELKRGPISIGDAVQSVHQAAEAIHAAHQQGIIHCDLKPANLVRARDGRVVVTDFGLAFDTRHSNELPAGGTAAYMAIEQVVPGMGQIGPWTDVFSLGSILYALLTGHPPYVASRTSEVLSKLLAKSPFPRPSELRPEVTPELEELCLHCLQRDPRNRLASALELAARLHAINCSK